MRRPAARTRPSSTGSDRDERACRLENGDYAKVGRAEGGMQGAGAWAPAPCRALPLSGAGASPLSGRASARSCGSTSGRASWRSSWRSSWPLCGQICVRRASGTPSWLPSSPVCGWPSSPRAWLSSGRLKQLVSRLSGRGTGPARPVPEREGRAVAALVRSRAASGPSSPSRTSPTPYCASRPYRRPPNADAAWTRRR